MERVLQSESGYYRRLRSCGLESFFSLGCRFVVLKCLNKWTLRNAVGLGEDECFAANSPRKGEGGDGYDFNYFREISPTAVQTRINNGDVIILQKNQETFNSFFVIHFVESRTFSAQFAMCANFRFRRNCRKCLYNRAIGRGQLKYLHLYVQM